MKGNEAMAEAAVQAGCDAYFGYPITPQAELLEWMARRMPELGRVFIQAESELGAINMALGAAATGKRAEARGICSWIIDLDIVEHNHRHCHYCYFCV